MRNIKISHFQASKNHVLLLHCEFFLQITTANSYLPILSKLTAAALLVYKLCRAFPDSVPITCSFQFCYFNTSILSTVFRDISGFIFYTHLAGSGGFYTEYVCIVDFSIYRTIKIRDNRIKLGIHNTKCNKQK